MGVQPRAHLFICHCRFFSSAFSAFPYPVQCPIAVTPQPFEDYVVGGSTVSLAISDPCFLASDDTPNCFFDGFMVPAERRDANTATCVVPSMSDPGSVPFEFSYSSRTLGHVTFTSMFEACTFYMDLNTHTHKLQQPMDS